MTDEEWDGFALLLDKGFKWREPFGAAHETAYRALLDGYEGEQIAFALRALIARGQVFGPTPGEIVEVIREDPSRPTFEEFFRLVYGSRGVLRARPEFGASFANEAEMRQARDRAAEERAAGMHPLVASFVSRYGVGRLRALEVDHEQFGDAKRRELRAAWERHVEAMDGRETVALASGRREGLKQLDPLAAVGQAVLALPTGGAGS